MDRGDLIAPAIGIAMVILCGRPAATHLVEHGWDGDLMFAATVIGTLLGLLITVHSVRDFVRHFRNRAIRTAERKQQRIRTER